VDKPATLGAMPKHKHKFFDRFAVGFAHTFGSPLNFTLQAVVVLGWLFILGPIMHWSTTWQLLINTPTTIIELFAAITIQYGANLIRIEQEKSERHMLTILTEIQALAELLAANDDIDLPTSVQKDHRTTFTY
jgi:low affinity Fe/Cu permease